MKRRYQCPCGRWFDNSHALNAHKHSCKDGHADTLARREKALKLKESRRLPNGMFKCENPRCGKEHDGSYGSGRFCSKHCRCSFSGKKCTHFPTREDLLKRKGMRTGKPGRIGGWKCEYCNLVFETRATYRKHCKDVGHPNRQGWAKGLTAQTNTSIARQVKTYKDGLSKGRIIPANRGRKMSETAKENMRKGRAKYLMNVLGAKPSYNKKSIPILECIAKEHGWHIQHAENGGEFYTGIGYFVDAYGKEKNVVLEYDEPYHYIDKENNILREKDLVRQRKIIEHLHCEYWRFNEKTQTLWRVQ